MFIWQLSQITVPLNEHSNLNLIHVDCKRRDTRPNHIDNRTVIICVALDLYEIWSCPRSFCTTFVKKEKSLWDGRTPHLRSISKQHKMYAHSLNTTILGYCRYWLETEVYFDICRWYQNQVPHQNGTKNSSNKKCIIYFYYIISRYRKHKK